jgi:SAM-dependent methyltransferase
MGHSPLQDRVSELAETTFLGGPIGDFERIGRLGFTVLLQEGLRPSSRVLDVGCGALRLGYWLMRFLDPGRYFGIEPQQSMVETGLHDLIEPEIVARAQPRFSSNDDFDFSVFDERFDFVYARSIWTHASKPQISSMLSSFAANTSPGAVFLASYYPASQVFRLSRRWWLNRLVCKLPLTEMSAVLARLPSLGIAREYEGEQWAGRSHECDKAALAKHSLRWVAGEARRHGLTAQLAPYPVFNRQYWLRMRHAPAG